MRNAIIRFAKFIVRSRVAQGLFIIHLLLVVYAFSMKPRANFSDLNEPCHGIPVADRSVHLCTETGLINFLGNLDFLAVWLYVIFSMFCLFLGLLLEMIGVHRQVMSTHVFSWIVAVLLLAYTSFQWMFVGASVQWLGRRFVKRR